MSVERKYLKQLIQQVEIHLSEIDKIMRLSSNAEWDKLIAQTCNNLELVKDEAKRFGLGLDFNGKELKRRC